MRPAPRAIWVSRVQRFLVRGQNSFERPERSDSPDEGDPDPHGGTVDRARQKGGEGGRNQGVDPGVVESLESRLPDDAPGETVIEGAGGEYSDEGDCRR